MVMIETDTQATFPTQQKRSWLKIFAVLCTLGVLAFVACALLAYHLNQAPEAFSAPVSVEIESGTTVRTITEKLEAAGVVRSAELLYFVITLKHDPTDIKASRYVFAAPLSATDAARQLVAGDFNSDLVRFTHREGERATLVAENAAATLQNFDKDMFLQKAIPLEGRLYPETYHIPVAFTADELLNLMTTTFSEKVAPLQSQIDAHSLTLHEIIVLASILEREANSPESMRVVSGILQGRMEAGMPLQADASIEYILDKPLKELTAEDLKVDSPYNTYTNRGLPPTPIGNPGIDAIKAVLEPEVTEYVFYITDNDGNFHYAKTYDEHLDNVEKYLR
jgi:UPF0755 protein